MADRGMAGIRGGGQIALRGDIVLAVLPGEFGKPRPTLVVQSDAAADLPSVALCPLTSYLEPNKPAFRIDVAPSPSNGLFRPSQVMVDKVNVVARDKVRDRIGRLDEVEMDKVSAALSVLLGLA